MRNGLKSEKTVALLAFWWHFQCMKNPCSCYQKHALTIQSANSANSDTGKQIGEKIKSVHSIFIIGSLLYNYIFSYIYNTIASNRPTTSPETTCVALLAFLTLWPKIGLYNTINPF